MPRLPVATATWVPEPSLATSAECWLMAGGPHHTVLSTAVGVEAVDDLAEIVGTELVHIGDTTRPRTFLHELRWNNAYHRLARGF